MERETLLAAHAHRHVVLEGAINVRDLGGLPTQDGRLTRRGILYRADALARLSESDCDRLQALQLRSVIDLRTAEERARAPDRLPVIPPLRVRAPGFIPEGNLEMFAAINAGQIGAEEALEIMCGQYRRLVIDHRSEYREFVQALLAPDHAPLLFHCASGKDRTGVAAAIALLAVDVGRETILEDYRISHFQRPPMDLFAPTASAAAVDQVMSADPRYLDAAFAAMEAASGSTDAYLAELGADREARRHLRQRFVG